MPMPRVIGISFACLVTCSCTAVKTAENNPSRDPAASAGNRSSAAVGCCGQPQISAESQFGEAAWYDLVGKKTASGEKLDTVTATAANRSLPLGTFARVTDLDNGRAVIVKINDRGPYTRGRIIDLSPRAAEALHMKGAGVAAVVVEPIEYQIGLVDALQIAGAQGTP